jgi:hypothetical protein
VEEGVVRLGCRNWKIVALNRKGCSAVGEGDREEAKGRVIFSTMKMEAVSLCETSINFYQTHHGKQ